VLKSDEGRPDRAISALPYIHEDSVRNTRKRFVEEGLLAGLEDNAKPTPEPKLNDEQMEHLLALYARPYDLLYPVGCFDEKSYPLLADSRLSLPLRPKHPRRQDYEYRRRGTRTLFVMVEPLAGQRHVLLTKRRTKADFAHAVRYPNANGIELVLDNLNTHTYQALVDTFGILEAHRIMRRICFHYTPVHASWLNKAEIEIGILSRQCLRRHLASEYVLQSELSPGSSSVRPNAPRFIGHSRP
jgi:hypothetical protein